MVQLELPDFPSYQAYGDKRIGRVDLTIKVGDPFIRRFVFADYDEDGKLTVPKDIETGRVWTSNIFAKFTTFELSFTITLEASEESQAGPGVKDTLVLQLTQDETDSLRNFKRLNFDVDSNESTAFHGYVFPEIGWHDPNLVVP